MAKQTQTSSEYFRVSPRAMPYTTNRMQATVVGDATDSASVSTEYWLFPIPPKCFVTGGAITASCPAAESGAGGVVVKLGTQENDSAFGSYTITSTAATQTRLAIYAPVTVSASDDKLPYFQPVIAAVSAVSTSTTSVSIFVVLEYVMPGNLP